MNAALIALGGIVGVLLLALFGILRDGKRREEAWEDLILPPDPYLELCGRPPLSSPDVSTTTAGSRRFPAPATDREPSTADPRTR